MKLKTTNAVVKTAGIKISNNALVLVVILVFSCSVFAEWKTFGNVTRIVEKKANGVVLETSSRSKVEISFTDQTVVRVRFAPSGKLERDFSYAIQSIDRKMPEVKIVDQRDEIILTNSFGAKVSIKKSPLLVTIYDVSGDVACEDDAAKPAIFDEQTGEVQMTKRRRGETETYYGFGEKAFAGMSRNGQYIVNWNTDTYAFPQGLDPIYQTIPFFYAVSNGKTYGLFLNNTFRSYFDMGKTAPDRYTFGADGGELDYFVFTGGKEKTPHRVLEDYANLTGKTPLPPLWALGNQQSRWSYSPEIRVREIAAGFRSRKIPADVIYLDIDYMNEYRVFTWNKERFPNPPKLISDLAADGFKTVLIVDPGVKKDENYAVYNDGKKQGVFVKNPDGSELNMSVWAGNSAFPDFTDPKARAWFGAQYKKHTDEGVAGFWNDMNEPATFLNDKSAQPPIFHHPGKTFPVDTPHIGDGFPATHRRYHNVYGMQMARSTFEGLKKLQPEKRPFVLTRAGFAGVQRFSAVWTGDNIASWEHLQLSIPMLANLSVSGVPFVGADVGGFSGVPSGELYARWLQAAALTPFLRSHSETGIANKEPWEYGDDFTKINRVSIELRYQLLPYLYTLFREHEQTGMPVMRPLWFEYPGDTNTCLIDNAYLVGKDLLVAPVIKENQRRREVYFPKGDDWRDWQTGELYKGGTYVQVDAPLDKLLLFARVGAVIPNQPTIQHTGEMRDAPLTLTVIAGSAPDQSETANVFQDAGEGFGYRHSDFREIRIEHKNAILRLTQNGSFAAAQKIKFIESLGLDKKPSAVSIDGKTSKDFDFDAKKKRLQIALSDGEPKEIAIIP